MNEGWIVIGIVIIAIIGVIGISYLNYELSTNTISDEINETEYENMTKEQYVAKVQKFQNETARIKNEGSGSPTFAPSYIGTKYSNETRNNSNSSV
ncbi:MAG: hypothetical protein ACRC1M_00480 [Methanobacteriaceae archaeon]